MKTTIEMQQNLMFQLPTLQKHSFISEKEFTTWFWNQIDKKWWLWHKISDQSSDLKPCDWIVAINWLCWLVEIKVWNEKKKINVFKKLRPNQAFGLRKYKQNWWTSIVVYYSKLHHKYWVMEFEEEMLLFISE